MINKNKELILPEETTEIVFNLLKKYKLEKNQEEIKKKISGTEAVEEIRKIALTLPSIQIIITVKEFVGGGISPENMASLLRERLKITEEEAEKLAEDLKKDIINLVKTQSSEIFTLNKKLNKEKSAPQKKQTISKETDTYREPVK